MGRAGQGRAGQGRRGQGRVRGRGEGSEGRGGAADRWLRQLIFTPSTKTCSSSLPLKCIHSCEEGVEPDGRERGFPGKRGALGEERWEERGGKGELETKPVSCPLLSLMSPTEQIMKLVQYVFWFLPSLQIPSFMTE